MRASSQGSEIPMLLQPLTSEGQSKDFGCLAKQIGWSAAHEFLVESDARSTPLSRYSVPVAGRGSTGEMSFAASGSCAGASSAAGRSRAGSAASGVNGELRRLLLLQGGGRGAGVRVIGL